MPDGLGGALWRLVNYAVFFGAFAWFVKVVLPGAERLGEKGLAALWLLLLPLSLGSMNNGQANVLLMGLLLAAVRGIPQLDVAVHEGIWRTALPLPPSVSYKRLGIVGLGTIGQQIAKRALGFDMEIGYHGRSARSGVSFTYFESLLDLAKWADFLVIATPGGAATRHLINREVLDALGSTGVLVNIARGSVVDTEALAQALRQHRIAAAGLDVYESEPEPPQQLMHLPNVVLTPHVAGWSPESVDATVRMFLDNAGRHFSGKPVLTPV